MLRSFCSLCLGLLALWAPFAIGQPASADLSAVAFASVGAARVGFRSTGPSADGLAIEPAHDLLDVTAVDITAPHVDVVAEFASSKPVMDLSVERTVAQTLGLNSPADFLDAPALADTVRSPLDTLRMSTWERVWWGRRGLMRQVGLFPTHPDQPLDDLRQVAHVRRTMLKWHQTLGLVTVASMGTTVIAGQLAASGNGSGFHEATLPVTIGLYSTTAALALLSPPKPITLDRGGGIDSITIHRWLAVGHIAGMLITPLLGEDADTAHYAMGYATFATFSAAMLTVTLLRR